MFYYDARPGADRVVLTAFAGCIILATSAIRLHHESRHFELAGQGRRLVLQLLTGIGKLRVAGATARALAVWSQAIRRAEATFHRFAARRRTLLSVFETAFPTVATLAVFAGVLARERADASTSAASSRSSPRSASPWPRSGHGRGARRIADRDPAARSACGR